MDQISVNASIKTLVNSVNPDPIKYQLSHQFYTWKKNVLGVDSTTNKL